VLQFAVPNVELPASRLGMGVDLARNDAHFELLLDDFFERGGNVFETARAYGGGYAERFLGDWLTRRGLRQQVIVISKGAHTPRCNPVDLTRQLHESLNALQIEQLDVYLMHRDNLEIPVAEFVDVLNEHFQAGCMRVLGVSNWSIERLEAANAYAARRGLEPLRILSNHLSLARMVAPPWPGCLDSWQPEQRAYLTAHQMPLVAWSTGARGFFAEADGPPEASHPTVVMAWHSEDNFERRRRARLLAQERGVTPTAVAIAYVLAQAFPTLALIGPKTPLELQQSVQCLDVQLSPSEMAWLDLGVP
jgi:aryl-alcohol dehydrogenase-like predicted oxidoreductase